MNLVSPILSSPLPTLAAVTSATPSTLAPAPAQPQTPQASTSVVLGAGAADLQVYTPLFPHASAPVWETNSTDPVSTLMAGNFSSSGLSGRFQGLGSALIQQLAGSASGFSQSVYRPALGTTPDAAVNSATQTALHAGADQQISLEITTRGGAKVQITLGSQEDGLAASITVTDGTLSDADQSAILKLADAFQSAIDGLTGDSPALKLDGLVQFDTSVLASVDLHASLAAQSGQSPLTVDFHADSRQRSVKTTGGLGTLQINMDMSDTSILGSADQQAKALAAYLQQFDAERGRGNGNAVLMAMFTDAFKALNSHYPSPDPANAALRSVTLGGTGHSLLSGLADFDASVSQATNGVNPMRPGEADNFDYQVSQHTDLQSRGPLDYSVTQTQQASLHASFHQAPAGGVLALGGDTRSQNYYYDEINDNSQSQATFGYAEGRLSNATLTQSASQSTRVRQYVDGELQQDITTPYAKSWSQDLLGLLTQPSAELLSRIHDLVALPSDPQQLANKQPVR